MQGIDSLGVRLLKSLLASKDVLLLERLRIDDFLLGKSRDMFAWILEYGLKFNGLPTEAAFIDEFGNVLPNDIEAFPYLHEQILKRNLGFKLTQSLQQVGNSLDNNDPDAALQQLVQVVQNTNQQKVDKVSFYNKEASQRIQTYKHNVTNKVFEGIETPWEEINEHIQGLMNGCLHVVLGRPNQGKSWMVCILADHCLKKSKSALLVTLEMPSIRIARRLDAIRHKLSFGKLRNNVLLPADLQKWEDSVANDKTVGDIILVDKQKVRTVVDVALLVKKYKPDIVLIDGGYRFSGRSKSHWENTVEIVNDLQIYAEETNIPWVVTNQYGELGNNKQSKDDPTAKMEMKARYGAEWVMAPDVVLGIQQSPDDRVLRRMQVHILKVRDSAAESNVDQISISWNLVDMQFDATKSILDDVQGNRVP